MTYKLSGFHKNKVIGSGTLLDTARFKYLLGQELGIDTRNIHGYILGEHGDSEFAAWSSANIAGSHIDLYCNNESYCKEKIFNHVKNSAYEIINKKGATYYAIALAVKRIVEAIFRNENSILTISSILNGEYGIYDVALSLPTIIGKNGIINTFNTPLDESEQTKLVHSANTLKKIISSCNIQ